MQFTVDHERLALETNLQVSLGDVDSQLFGCGALGDDNIDGNFLQSLLPRVLICRPAISRVGDGTLSLFLLVLFALGLLFSRSIGLS